MRRVVAGSRKPPAYSSLHNSNSSNNINNNNNGNSKAQVAAVVRRNCGTSPFDKHWLNVDCCGLFCAGFTYCLHLYGCYAVCFVLLPPWMSSEDEEGERKLTIWGIFHSISFCIVAFLAILSHFKAMTTDPGAVPPDAEPVSMNSLDNSHNNAELGDIKEPLTRPSRAKRLCRRCNAYKPERAHHCSICKRCIIKMDHHCPWVNNCVGIGNHKYFLLFIFYTFCSCSYSMTLIVSRFVNCIGHIEKNEPCLDKPTHLLSLIGLVVESMLFGMFTCCMMLDQWDVVLTKVTHIDRLKGGTTLNDETDSRAGVNEVFGIGLSKGKKGSSFRPDWLSPMTNVCFPESMKDEIMGFCRPCGFDCSRVKEEDYEPNVTTTNSAISNTTSNSNSFDDPSSGRRAVGSVAEIV